MVLHTEDRATRRDKNTCDWSRPRGNQCRRYYDDEEKAKKAQRKRKRKIGNWPQIRSHSQHKLPTNATLGTAASNSHPLYAFFLCFSSLGPLFSQAMWSLSVISVRGSPLSVETQWTRRLCRPQQGWGQFSRGLQRSGKGGLDNSNVLSCCQSQFYSLF